LRGSPAAPVGTVRSRQRNILSLALTVSTAAVEDPNLLAKLKISAPYDLIGFL